MPIWTNSWVVATWTQCLYILEIHSVHPPRGVALTFINISVSICETLRFRTLLLLFCFWEAARSISDFWPWRRDSWHRPQECINLVSQISWHSTIQTWWWPKFVLCFWWQFTERLGILLASLDFLGGSAGEQSACNAGNVGSISGLGRCPGERKSYPFQYSGLENSMGCKQSMGSQRVGHDWVTFTLLRFTSSAWMCLLGRAVWYSLSLCKFFSGTITQ